MRPTRGSRRRRRVVEAGQHAAQLANVVRREVVDEALEDAGTVAAVVGWVLAVNSGIGLINGLEVAESPGLPDGMAAALAALAVLGALAFTLRSAKAVAGIAVAAVMCLAVPAMVLASGGHGTHGDAEGEGAADDGHAGH